MPKNFDPKKERARLAHLQRTLRDCVLRLNVILFIHLKKKYEDWMIDTEKFSEALRILAREHFGDREDAEENWEQAFCEIVSDHALQAMNPIEKLNRDISTPRKITEWYAEYLEKTLSPKDLRWESSTFSEAKIRIVTTEIARITAWDNRNSEA